MHASGNGFAAIKTDRRRRLMFGEGGRMVLHRSAPRTARRAQACLVILSTIRRHLGCVPCVALRFCLTSSADCAAAGEQDAAPPRTAGGAAASSSLTSFESIWRSVRPEAAPAAGFAGSNPICPARQSGFCGPFAVRPSADRPELENDRDPSQTLADRSCCCTLWFYVWNGLRRKRRVSTKAD